MLQSILPQLTAPFLSYILNVFYKDLNECERNIYGCRHLGACANEHGEYSCKCNHGYFGEGLKCYFKSCSAIRQQTSVSGTYVIDPDGTEGLELAPFTVYCDMSDKNGVGVTVISHDTERRKRVKGTNNYVRDIHYTGASLSQLASLTKVSSNCEQFIQYECHNSFMTGLGWWVSRDSTHIGAEHHLAVVSAHAE